MHTARVLLLIAAMVLARESNSFEELLGPLGEARDSVEESLNTFVELGSSHSNGLFLVRSSRRRVTSHSPCECSESLDSLNDSCLSRRFDLISTAYDDLVNVADGVSSVLGYASALRTGFSTLSNESRIFSAKVTQLKDALYTPFSVRPGYVPQTRSALQRLLNEEYLMVRSVNSAWTNLINATTSFTSSAANVTNLTRTQADGSIDYFNAEQRMEEDLSEYNLNSSTSFASRDLQSAVDYVNIASAGAYQVLTATSDALGGANAQTQNLAEALNAARTSVNASIIAFNSTFGVNFTTPTGLRIQQEVEITKNSYFNNTVKAVSNFKSQAANKTYLFGNTTLAKLADQEGQYAGLFASSKSNARQTVNTLMQSETSFRNYSKDTFESTAVATINSLQANLTLAILASRNVSSGTLKNANGNLTGSTSILSGILADLSRNVANYSSKFDAISGNATSAANALAKTSNDISRSVLGFMSSNLSSAAVAAVGMSDGAAFDSLRVVQANADSSHASGDNVVGSQSVTVTSGLGNAVTGSLSSIANSANEVNGEVDSLASSAFGDLSGVVPDFESGSDAMSGLLSLADDVSGDSAASLDISANGPSTVNAYNSETAAEDAVGDSVRATSDFLANAAAVYDDATGSADSNSNNFSFAQSAPNPGLATTADELAEFEEAFADTLSGLTPAEPPSGAVSGTAPGSAALTGAATALDANRQQLLSILSMQEDSAEGAASATDKMIDLAARLWLAVRTNASFKSNQILQAVKSSVADVDEEERNQVVDASELLSKQIRDINSFELNQAASISSVNNFLSTEVNQALAALESVRSQVGSESLKFSTAVETKLRSNRGLQAQSLNSKIGAFLSTDKTRVYAGYQTLLGQALAKINSLTSDFQTANRTSLDRLNRVEVGATSTMDSVSQNVSSQVQAMMNKFGSSNGESVVGVSMARLSGVSDSALEKESFESSETSAPLMDQLKAAMSQLASVAAGNSASLATTNIGGGTVKLDSVYDMVIQAQQGQTGAAHSIQNIVDAQADSGAELIQQVKEFTKAESGKLPTDDTLRALSMARLSEQLASSKLASDALKLQKFANNSTQLIAEMKQSAEAQDAVRNNQAGLVYDTTLGLKQNVTNSLGRMLSSLSNSSSAAASNMEGLQSHVATQQALLAYHVNNLALILSKELQADNIQLNVSNTQRNEFASAILQGLMTQMSAGDQQLVSLLQDLMKQEDEINFQKADALAINELDTLTQHELAGVRDWLNGISSGFAADKATLSNKIAAGGIANLNVTVEGGLRKVVETVADSAVELIRNYGRTVPQRLLDYVSLTNHSVPGNR